MSSVRNLKQAVMPILWLNCIFGMGIFEIPINRPRYYLSVFYVILIVIGYFVLLYKEIPMFQAIFVKQFVIFFLVIGVNTLCAILAIILFWWKSENMNNIIKRSSIVDNTLEALGIKKEYQKMYRNVRYYTAIWIIIGIILISIHVVWVYRDVEYWAIFYNNICMSFPIIINFVMDLTFTSFIKSIQIRFQETNMLIHNVVLCANESNIFMIHNRHDTKFALIIPKYKNRKDNIKHLIQTTRQLHLEITRIGQQINYTYSLQLLLQLGVHFTIVTTTTYCLYCVFSGQLSIPINNEKIGALTIVACIYSLKVILVNGLCTNVSTEAYKTGKIIQSFEGSVIDDDMRQEIQQFTQQIMLNSLNFTAAGFFSINNSLTSKFFATVMTYVVILIQMNTFK